MQIHITSEKLRVQKARLRRIRRVGFSASVLMTLCALGFTLRPSPSLATSYTWDGGGGDNNWSTCANWSGDTCPTSSDSIVFNGTSTKNATIDGSFTGTVASITISSGYSGTITMARSFTVSGAYSQGAGSFTAANQTLSVGSFSLSSGVFTASSGTMSDSGDLTITGGTFNHNSGTVLFNGGDASATLACNNVTFNLVQITRNSTSILNFGKTLTINSDCSFPLGSNPTVIPAHNTNVYNKLVLNGTLSGSGTITFSYTDVGGDVQLNAGASLSGFSGANFDGTNLVVQGATLNAGSYNPFTIDGGFSMSSGAFTAPSGTMSVSTDFNITGGTFSHNNGTLVFNGGGSSATYSCNNVTFYSVQITRNSTSLLNQPATLTVNSDCSFPLGNNPTIIPSHSTNVSNNLILNGTLSGTGTITFQYADVGGDVTMNSGSSLSGFNGLIADGMSLVIAGATLDTSSYNPVTISGNFGLSSGTFTAPTGTMSVAGNFTITGGGFNNSGGTLLFNGGNSSATYSCNLVSFSRVQIARNSTSLVNQPVTLTINNNCIFPLGNNPTVIVGHSTNVSNTLDLYGILTGTGRITFSYTDTGGTVKFHSSGGVGGFNAITADHNNLMVDGADITLHSFYSVIVGGDFTLLNGTNLTSTDGTLSISGNLDIQDTSTFDPASGTVDFTGTSQTITCPSFNLVRFSGNGVKTLTNDCVFPIGNDPTFSATFSTSGTVQVTGSGTLTAGNLTLNSHISIAGFSGLHTTNNLTVNGTTFDATAYSSFTVGGAFLLTNSAIFDAPPTLTIVSSITKSSDSTFNHENGTVILDPDVYTQITGDITFYNLTKSNSYNGIVFKNGNTVTVLGTLTLIGYSSSNPMYIYSDSPGQTWSIDPQGARTVQYLNIQDSTNINTTAITALDSTDSGNNTNWNIIAPPPPVIYNASDVLGADDFTTSGSFNGDGLSPVVDTTHHRLFVSDSANGNIYIYNLDTNNNLVDKNYDYYLHGGTTTFYYQGGMAYDPIHDRLFVADTYGNCRVLVYDTSNLSDDMPAAHVLGAPDVDSAGTCGLDDHSLGGYDYYGSVAYDTSSQRLYVMDGYENDRIMVFDLSSGITDNMPATNVLGASDFTTSGSGTVSASTFGGLSYGNLAVDSVRHLLFVASYDDYRVVVYDLAEGITDGMDASYILGGDDINSSGTCNVDATGMCPVGIEYNSDQQLLFVSDYESYRIMVFDLSGGISDNMEPIAVIGQPDFVTSNSGTTQQYIYLYDQANLSYDYANRRLYLGDDYNGRVMIYDFVRITAAGLGNGTTGTAYSQSVETEHSQGDLSFSITDGALPPGLAIDAASGAITGTPLEAGDYTFTVKVTDTPGDFGYFYDIKEMTLHVVLGASTTPAVENSSDTTTTKTIKKTVSSAAMTDDEVVPANPDLESNTNTPSTPSPSPTTTPTPAPKTITTPGTTISVVWWGVGGMSLLVLLVVVGRKVLKRSAY